MPEKSKLDAVQGVQSLEVGLALLRSFLVGEQPCSLSDLARRAGMHRAKAYRYLVSLQRTDWIAQDPESGLYEPGAAVRDLALDWWSRQDLLGRAISEASSLAQTQDETCFVALWRSEGATVARVFQPARTVAISVQEGAVLPAATSATGRLFAAWRDQPGESVASRLGRTIRTAGVSVVNGDHVAGINAVAAPVFDDQRHIALALTLVGPAATLDTAIDGRCAQALRDACARLSARGAASD
jgi:DNA-binding IclR family transcriptional regulator